jgi:hypothetical protein
MKRPFDPTRGRYSREVTPRPQKKVPITIRVAPYLLEFFRMESRRTGGKVGYQTLLHSGLEWYYAARCDAGTAGEMPEDSDHR